MSENSAPMRFNFNHYEFLTQHTGQWEKIIALVNSQDDIGVFLRAHLLIEQSVEAWCICSTGNGAFFKGFGENVNMDFAAKAQLALNFGLSEPVTKFVKKLNRFRNKRSHQINHPNIEQSEIDSLTALIKVDYPKAICPIEKFALEVTGLRTVMFNDPDASLRDKLIMLYSMLALRMSFEAKVIRERDIS